MSASPSATHVALLRGINVGRGNRIAMADLREAIAAKGYDDVRTLLASGNVLFRPRSVSTDESAAAIAEVLRSSFGIFTSVVVLTGEEIADVVSGNPWSEQISDASRLLISIPFIAADVRRLKPLLGMDWGTSRLALGDRVAYLWCPEGILASELPDAVSRALGNAVTSRNLATMLKLHSLTS
ncbi:MAG: DUF1697 domain-containing protein, partial [Gemmatimonadaceae bacterium]|nr:DUF1697 domain-containing protein [Gemmatimonadaceae bacterium]